MSSKGAKGVESLPPTLIGRMFQGPGTPGLSVDRQGSEPEALFYSSALMKARKLAPLPFCESRPSVLIIVHS